MPTSSEIRPNLFIIGAAKCGTTSLHHSLERHPDIFMSDPKEPGYFSPGVGFRPTDEAWYLGLFAGAGNAKIVGESSTHYSKLPTYPGVPERIRAFCESPRFIYVMRDPIDRMISQYWFGVQKETEFRSLAQTIREDSRLTDWGDYKMQLEPYFETFGRDRVLVLTFEELIASQEAVVRSVFEWLGVDPTLAPPTLAKENMRPETLLAPRGFGLLQRFRHSKLWGGMAPYFPKGVRSLGHRLSRRPLRPQDVSIDEVVESLRPLQREKVRELSRFLGREFPEWRTTLGDGALDSTAPPSVRSPG